MVNQGANKCLSNVSVVENYKVGYDMVMEYHNTLRNSNIELKIPPPPKVRLNSHNIVDVPNSLFQVSTEVHKYN